MNAPDDPSARHHWRELIHRHLSGDLSVAESRELESLLADHREARTDFRLLCNLDTALRGAAMAESRDEEAPVAAVETKVIKVDRAAWNFRGPLAAAAAIVVLSGLAGWWWVADSRDAALTLTEAADRVEWQEKPGLPKRSLQTGDRVGPGTLTIQGEGAGAVLNFRDGSILTLTAGAELTWHADEGKHLFLRSGELSADVAPQPKGRPMRVTTPTSEATVLGTTFSMTVKPDRTVVQVDEGVVAVQRLADREEVKVRTGQRLVTTVDMRTGVQLALSPAPARTWRADLSSALRDPADALWKAPGVVETMPVDYPNAQGEMTRYYRVRFPIAWSDAPRLTGRSRVRVRYRVTGEGEMGVGIVARDDRYRFQGVYQSNFATDAGQPDGDGWRSFELPATAMTGIKTHAGQKIPEDAAWRTSIVFFATKSADLDLEIGGAEFFTP